MRARAALGIDPAVVLQEGLSEQLGRPVRITELVGRSLGSRSIHPIDRLAATLADGERLAVIFKRLVPEPGKDVHREVLVYRRLLVGLGADIGAPRLWASCFDEAEGRYWLFLEDVGQHRLDWCGLAGWAAASRWLAGMHATWAGREGDLAALGCLGDHGPVFYRAQATSARASIAERGTARALDRFDRAMDGLDAAVAWMADQPRTLVHGDVSGHNLMVQPVRRIRPVDWEWAAVGLGAWDLAKLVAGWGSKKDVLVGVYADELARQGGEPLDPRALAHCQAVKALWHLRWWVEGCDDPAFVDRLVDRIEQAWRPEGRADRRGRGPNGPSAKPPRADEHSAFDLGGVAAEPSAALLPACPPRE